MSTSRFTGGFIHQKIFQKEYHSGVKQIQISFENLSHDYAIVHTIKVEQKIRAGSSLYITKTNQSAVDHRYSQYEDKRIYKTSPFGNKFFVSPTKERGFFLPNMDDFARELYGYRR